MVSFSIALVRILPEFVSDLIIAFVKSGNCQIGWRLSLSPSIGISYYPEHAGNVGAPIRGDIVDALQALVALFIELQELLAAADLIIVDVQAL